MTQRPSRRLPDVMARLSRSAGRWALIATLGAFSAPVPLGAQSELPVLSIGDTFVVEGDTGTQDARFLVTLSPTWNQRVTVSWATRDGTAQAGSDYEAAAGTLTFEPGQSTRPIEVTVFGDREPEDDETFFVDLFDPNGAALGRSRGRATILDDDSRSIGIEAVGDDELGGRVGGLVELLVLVTDDETGEPVAQVPVTWEVTGNATPAEAPPGASVVVTHTAESGQARLPVRLGQEPGQATVTATLTDGDSVTFRIQVRGDLSRLFDPNDEPGPRSVADVIDSACPEATGPFGQLCDHLFSLEDPDARIAILELTPREAAAMGIVGREGARTQVENVWNHLAASRRGGGPTTENLAFVIQGQRLAAAAFEGAFGDPREAELRLAARVDDALAGSAQTGTVTTPLPEGVPRWSIFASGQVSSGDRESTSAEAGFDLGTTGVTVGIDFQASRRWILGLAAGFLDSGNDFFEDGGSLDVRGYSATVFAGYAGDAAYFDLVGSWGANEYELERNLDIPGLPRLTARGAPDGDQVAFAAALGYDASFGANGFGIFARGSYVESTIDAFVESGAGATTLSMEEQTLESLLTEAGLELTRAISTSWGVFLPQLRLAWLHELEDDARLIRGRFVDDRSFLEFVVPTDAPDADYFNAGIGFTATFARGWSAYLFADQDLERDDLDLLTVSGGFRLEL